MLATHEIGHAIGLDHNFEKRSIMYPYYNGYIGNFSLSEYDHMLIKDLYSKQQCVCAVCWFLKYIS